MIKAHCPKCGRIFLGESCACGLGRKPALPKCECGKPAREVYLDDLGEWPLCAACLEFALDEFAPMPLPVDDDQEVPGDFDGSGQWERSAPVGTPAGVHPGAARFGLTERQSQVAALAHLSNQQIADRLGVSSATVRTHMNKILKKLDLRSRYEIRYVLDSLPGTQSQEMGEPSVPAAQASEAAPQDELVTITVTVASRRADWIRRFLQSLLK